MDTSERAAMAVQEAVERRIRAEYRKAQRELTDKLHGFIEGHKAREAKYRAMVAAGEMEQEDFDAWMQGQIFQSKQWMRMRDSVARTLYQADVSAQKIVNGERGNIFAQSANHTLYDLEHETGVTFGFELYDQSTVAKILREQPRLLPPKKVAEAKDIEWYQHKINSVVVQGIIQGEGIGQIASRVGRETGELSRNAMLRNARTAMTSAHSAGKLDAMHAMKERGIDVKKRWVATLDLKTRPAHASLDGVEVDIDEPFTTPMGDIERPGDPNAPACLVFNCRCMLFSVFGKYPASYTRRDMNGEMVKDMTYEEWAKAHGYVKQPKKKEHVIAQGTDISGTWTRRADQFQFEINDVLNAQGFDGVPRVVDPEEFDKAVQESHFIAQRSYTGENQEQAELYQDMLYNGEWYVACTTGGAQYGQGMYCAADYTGTLTSGIREEMQHYRELNESKIGDKQREYAEKLYQEEMHSVALPFDEKYRSALTDEFAITSLWTSPNSEERLFVRRWIAENGDSAEKLREALVRAQTIGMQKGMDIEKLSKEEFAKLYPHLAPKSITETLTLDPSAKVITYDEARELHRKYMAEHSYEVTRARAEKTIFDGMGLSPKQQKDYEQMLKGYSGATTKKQVEKYEAVKAKLGYDTAKVSELEQKVKEEYNRLKAREISDVGSHMAALGYDAINAEGHGASGSYTVILNRTKVIFRRGA